MPIYQKKIVNLHYDVVAQIRAGKLSYTCEQMTDAERCE